MKFLAYFIILFSSFGWVLVGCSPGGFLEKTVRPREDIREATFWIPAVSSQECLGILHEVLSRSGMVREMRVEEGEGKLTVVYNSRYTAKKNIEYGIAAAGFDIDETVGDPDAKRRLPEACR